MCLLQLFPLQSNEIGIVVEHRHIVRVIYQCRVICLYALVHIPDLVIYITKIAEHRRDSREFLVAGPYGQSVPASLYTLLETLHGTIGQGFIEAYKHILREIEQCFIGVLYHRSGIVVLY